MSQPKKHRTSRNGEHDHIPPYTVLISTQK